MKRISPLGEQLANQIAAGEVIERPSSVVKELLENCLDAGADRIEIRIQDGGTQGIQIIDNGAGIHRDDLFLAVKPHATSKISAVGDLNNLSTMGFRGEALASISSVSRFHLSSRQHHEEQAWCLQVGYGENDFKVLPGTGSPGTMIQVKELFYNTPARRRFLRADKTEFAHIENTVKRFVMGAFHVTVFLYHNDKLVRRYFSVQNPELERRRLGDIFGKAFITAAIAVRFQVGRYLLHGWVSEPGYHRSSNDGQYFYINQRVVRDKFLNHAVKEAYGERIPAGRFPCYALYLELPTDELDVNVHPMKNEVRFRHARDVHDMVVQAISASLQQGYKKADIKPVFQVKEPEQRPSDMFGTEAGVSKKASQQNRQNRAKQSGERQVRFSKESIKRSILATKSANQSESTAEPNLSSEKTHLSNNEGRNSQVSNLNDAQKGDAHPSSEKNGLNPTLHWLGAEYFWYKQGQHTGIIDAKVVVNTVLTQRWKLCSSATKQTKPFLLPPSYELDRRKSTNSMTKDKIVLAFNRWGIDVKLERERLLLLSGPIFFRSWTLPIEELMDYLAARHWQVDEGHIFKFCQLAIQKHLVNEPKKLEAVLQECLETVNAPYPRDWFRQADATTLSAWFHGE